MKEQLIMYLKENVLGKILRTDDVIYLLDEGKLKDVYSDQMMFSDLLLTENGVQFNMTTIATEKVYYYVQKGIVAFNFLKLKELKGVLKEAGNDKVAEVQLHIALLCINSNISVAQR